MLRAVALSNVVRRSVGENCKNRGAIGLAVSLVVAAHLKDDGDPGSKGEPCEASTQSVTWMDFLPWTRVPCLSSLRASCDARSVVSPTGQRSRLARRHTIRKMDDSSSDETLESKYLIRWGEPLGEGAFGAVYLATDRRTGERMALKKISKKFTDDVAFQHEMNALMHLRKAGGHPNICSLREHFNEGGNYFLILDLVLGGEMFDHLVSNGPYSEADAARLIREAASALAFIHGMDTTHGDLKPENLMLSTENPSDAVIKVVDFGCAKCTAKDSVFSGKSDEAGRRAGSAGKTPAYCPPEMLDKQCQDAKIEPPMDMWALGVILYIMLTGMHPYDLSGEASDEEIESAIASKTRPPLRNSRIVAHLSNSAIDLMKRLMCMDPKRRITSLETLEHPWVKGETANRDKMADSDKKLSFFRRFKTRIAQKVFENILSWSDEDADQGSRRMSLIERSFHLFDPQRKGYIDSRDLGKLANVHVSSDEDEIVEGQDSSQLSLSQFEALVSDSLQNRYYPKGHTIIREGDTGNHMYFINSGTVEVSTTAGSRHRIGQGDFFGEGALLHPNKIRSSTIRCVTPVHAIQISREYFEKYLAGSDLALAMNLREKNKTRKQSQATSLLQMQGNLVTRVFKRGEYLYKVGGEGEELFILDDGKIDVVVEDHTVFTLQSGDMCGEHALITGRCRNSSGVCVSDECIVQAMRGQDFAAFLRKSSPLVKESMYDICMRRELQKAIVFKTKKEFPSDNKDLWAAFEAADEDHSGKISLDNVRTMLLRMDPTITETDMKHVLRSLDLDESGDVKWEEFQRIFATKTKVRPEA